MKLDDLPRYLEAPNGGMWRLPDDYPATTLANVYVKLDDVERLLEETCIRHEETVMHDGTEFVSVGMGGPNLMDAAARQGWTLYAYNAAGGMTPGCLGNSDLVKYYIKQE